MSHERFVFTDGIRTDDEWTVEQKTSAASFWSMVIVVAAVVVSVFVCSTENHNTHCAQCNGA